MTVVVLIGCTGVGLTLVLLLIGAVGCVLSVDVSASRCASRVTSVDVEVSSCRSSDGAEISSGDDDVSSSGGTSSDDAEASTDDAVAGVGGLVGARVDSLLRTDFFTSRSRDGIKSVLQSGHTYVHPLILYGLSS